jgi:hypothetical protein
MGNSHYSVCTRRDARSIVGYTFSTTLPSVVIPAPPTRFSVTTGKSKNGSPKIVALFDGDTVPDNGIAILGIGTEIRVLDVVSPRENPLRVIVIASIDASAASIRPLASTPRPKRFVSLEVDSDLDGAEALRGEDLRRCDATDLFATETDSGFGNGEKRPVLVSPSLGTVMQVSFST